MRVAVMLVEEDVDEGVLAESLQGLTHGIRVMDFEKEPGECLGDFDRSDVKDAIDALLAAAGEDE
jgi:hypothetical protein